MIHSYDRWLSKRTVESIDCHTCVMTKAERPNGSRDRGPFREELKCCTYFPFLPNFTVGELLKKNHPLIRIAMKKGRLTPLGLFESETFRDLRESLGDEGFGVSPKLRCPFLTNGACSIWQNRPSVCSTYYCVSSRGHDAWLAEDESLRRFELTLAHASLWAIGFTEDDIESESWFEFSDKPEELFIRSYEASLQISREEVAELLGNEALV